MVWLDVTGYDGNALYFVTDRIERLSGMRTEGFTVSGILGDGGYEGEVIVEVGENPQVTFVDAWLARGDFSRFVASIDRERVSAALTERGVDVRTGVSATAGTHAASAPPTVVVVPAPSAPVVPTVLPAKAASVSPAK